MKRPYGTGQLHEKNGSYYGRWRTPHGRRLNRHGIAEDAVVATVQQVLRHGSESFGDPEGGVRFWSDVWDALHLEEIYEEIAAPAAMRVAPSVDLHLDELLDELPEWTRVHASTVAVESSAQTLALLHHKGALVAQDIFVREVSQYAAYRGQASSKAPSSTG